MVWHFSQPMHDLDYSGPARLVSIQSGAVSHAWLSKRVLTNWVMISDPVPNQSLLGFTIQFTKCIARSRFIQSRALGFQIMSLESWPFKLFPTNARSWFSILINQVSEMYGVRRPDVVYYYNYVMHVELHVFSHSLKWFLLETHSMWTCIKV